MSPLSRKGKWNWKAVLAFLKKEEAWREVLANLMLMTCGGQPRSPDLLNVRVRNDGANERSFHVYNGFVIYVTRSHKAKRSTNREFIVARFFPYQVRHLIYTHVVYIRPFVDMLAREQNKHVGDCSPYLFRSRAEADSPHWSTERLTKIIRRFTQEIWGQGITLRLLRQICIGIADKHVREVSRPFNRFHDRSDKADRGVAFAWSSGHRPLQRARTYGFDGAFPTHLQPQLLERYEWVSVCWHEFMHMPSRNIPKPAPKKPGPDRQIFGTPSITNFDDDLDNGSLTSPPQSSSPIPLSSTTTTARIISDGQNLLKRQPLTTSHRSPVKRRRNGFVEPSRRYFRRRDCVRVGKVVVGTDSIHSDDTNLTAQTDNTDGSWRPQKRLRRAVRDQTIARLE